MTKSTKKLTFALILLALIAIPKVSSYVSEIKKQKEAELAYQKILAEERAQKEAEERAEQKIYVMGKFEPALHPDFLEVPKEYNVGGYTMHLRKETLSAFLEMQKSAKEDGVDLKIASATRNFIYQKKLWENKWSGFTLDEGKDLSKSIPDGLLRFKKILEYSSAPGTSRHHFGSDIDINDANTAYFEKEIGKKVYEWLTLNASRFGFCQPYNLKNENRPTGYNEEKWHWSYLPLARTFTEQYKNLVQTEDINGFLGSEYVPQLNLINDYVLGINPECI